MATREAAARSRLARGEISREPAPLHRGLGLLWVLASVSLVCFGGCGETLPGSTVSLGGGTAGGRGRIDLLFINNTPFQAVFTFGSFDPLDQFTQPDFDQFSLAPPARTLEGNSRSDILSVSCGRVLGLGGAELLRFIERNRPDEAADELALVEGVEFFDVPPPDSDQAMRVGVGVAPPFEARLGVDFPCGALVILRLEFDERLAEPFRVDFEFIPPNRTR